MELSSDNIVGHRVATGSCEALVAEETSCRVDDDRRCRYFPRLTPRAAHIAADASDFAAALQRAGFLTPHGDWVVYATRARGGGSRSAVTGMDVFRGPSRAMNAAGDGSCFFLSSTDETLERIRSRMADDFASSCGAGLHSPPFRPEFTAEDNDEMIDAVNASGADVLWVGLTAPKQEKWIWRHRDRLAVNFAGPIGAAFDFYVGNIKRAGPLWQNLGLEWLPRLVQEPRRLWRRSLVSAPRFFYRALRYRGNNNMS